VKLPAPRLDHLLGLNDGFGVFEHARGATPRRRHGYCTDDVARALVIVLRAAPPPPGAAALRRTCIGFLEQAQLADGRFRNRRSAGPRGRWRDNGGPDDSIGRALWALGAAAVHAPSRDERDRAYTAFRAGAGYRSAWPRSAAAAALGAVEVMATHPADAAARGLVTHAAGILAARTPRRRGWVWLEPRLAYENARLPDALLACGTALGETSLVEAALAQLDWLISVETRGSHFSFAPVGGWTIGEPRPGFDQQPVEAGAMADACARAYAATADAGYADAVICAAAWFMGRNDAGRALYDPVTRGSGDGLHRDGVNSNQGAESTIALISALQQARIVQAALNAANSASSRTMAAPTARSAAP
jgi:hypothetical protein